MVKSWFPTIDENQLCDFWKTGIALGYTSYIRCYNLNTSNGAMNLSVSVSVNRLWVLTGAAVSP